MTKRRRCGNLCLLAGLCTLAVAVASEWIGVEWWSSVDLKRHEQVFLILVNGHVSVGTRGTAGFFTRTIPAAGARFMNPRTFDPEPWSQRFVPRRIKFNQTHGASIPVVSVGLLVAGLGGDLLVAKRKRGGHACQACGYDLSGLRAPVCPECGTLRQP